MQSPKIQLSPQHIKLVTNAEWILTKNEILGQIKTAFGHLYHNQQQVLEAYHLPAGAQQNGGKISRGENYLGLPWMVLDHPRHFAKKHVFAIRTLFWWGQFFSTTLHLSGSWQQQMSQPLAQAFERLQQHPIKISYSGDEWVHDLHNDSYASLQSLDRQSFEKIIQEAPFVKIAAYTTIENIENAIEILSQQFEFFITIIGNKS